MTQFCYVAILKFGIYYINFYSIRMFVSGSPPPVHFDTLSAAKNSFLFHFHTFLKKLQGATRGVLKSRMRLWCRGLPIPGLEPHVTSQGAHSTEFSSWPPFFISSLIGGVVHHLVPLASFTLTGAIRQNRNFCFLRLIYFLCQSIVVDRGMAKTVEK